MPPRKRARVSRATSPDRNSQTKTPTPAAPSPEHDTDENIFNDPWTDSEEIALFKGLMRWKPTGIHKHFHLLALHRWLLTNGHIHPRNAHTRPEGLWTKLNTLYDLSALDAREDARQLSKLDNRVNDDERENGDDDVDMDADDDASAYSEAVNKINQEEFALPVDDDDDNDVGFNDLMWKARLPDATGEVGREDDESDAELPEINLADNPPAQFVPSFSIEPSQSDTVVANMRTVGKGRGGAATAKGTRGRGAVPTNTRRSLRQAESVADENEEEEEETGEAESEDMDPDNGDEAEEEVQDSDEEASGASTPVPRSTRGSKGSTTTALRGRPPGSSRGRGRGRPKR